ncbi:MAG: methylmalonyl Co-A mutase-associated GTPase MeaB [Pseudomonadota bacterium]
MTALCVDELADRIRQGDRKALAQAITVIESTRSDHRSAAESLLEQLMPDSGRAIRIGITGVPGVGKSTFIESFGLNLLARGKHVAVLAIDPSSATSGGAILGDKTRMPNLSVMPNAFIRPSPAGRTLGGVARRTHESMLLCEAAGFDVLLIETVGVGQSEFLVSQMTDLFLLLILPSAGDDLQGIKRGIMELADMVVINKADGDLTNRARIAQADVKNALGLMQPRLPGWKVPVSTVSSTQQIGIDDVWQQVMNYFEHIDAGPGLKDLRANQAIENLWREAGEHLMSALQAFEVADSTLTSLRDQVAGGEIPASVAARQLVEWFLDSKSRGSPPKVN